MTCLAAITTERGIYYASDSAVSGDIFTFETVIPKIFVRAGVLIGSTGSYQLLNNLYNNLLLDSVEWENASTCLDSIIKAIKTCTSEPLIGASGQSQILIGFGSSLLQIDYSTLTPVKPWNRQYHAIGSGQSLAIGSLFTTERQNMEPMQRLKLAMEAAALIDSVQPPFTFGILPNNITIDNCQDHSKEPSFKTALMTRYNISS